MTAERDNRPQHDEFDNPLVKKDGGREPDNDAGVPALPDEDDEPHTPAPVTYQDLHALAYEALEFRPDLPTFDEAVDASLQGRLLPYAQQARLPAGEELDDRDELFDDEDELPAEEVHGRKNRADTDERVETERERIIRQTAGPYLKALDTYAGTSTAKSKSQTRRAEKEPIITIPRAVAATLLLLLLAAAINYQNIQAYIDENFGPESKNVPGLVVDRDNDGRNDEPNTLAPLPTAAAAPTVAPETAPTPQAEVTDPPPAPDQIEVVAVNPESPRLAEYVAMSGNRIIKDKYNPIGEHMLGTRNPLGVQIPKHATAVSGLLFAEKAEGGWVMIGHMDAQDPNGVPSPVFQQDDPQSDLLLVQIPLEELNSAVTSDAMAQEFLPKASEVEYYMVEGAEEGQFAIPVTEIHKADDGTITIPTFPAQGNWEFFVNSIPDQKEAKVMVLFVRTNELTTGVQPEGPSTPDTPPAGGSIPPVEGGAVAHSDVSVNTKSPLVTAILEKVQGEEVKITGGSVLTLGKTEFDNVELKAYENEEIVGVVLVEDQNGALVPVTEIRSQGPYKGLSLKQEPWLFGWIQPEDIGFVRLPDEAVTAIEQDNITQNVIGQDAKFTGYGIEGGGHVAFTLPVSSAPDGTIEIPNLDQEAGLLAHSYRTITPGQTVEAIVVPMVKPLAQNGDPKVPPSQTGADIPQPTSVPEAGVAQPTPVPAEQPTGEVPGLDPATVQYIDAHHNPQTLVDLNGNGHLRFYRENVAGGTMEYALVVIDENVTFRNVTADGARPGTDETGDTIWADRQQHGEPVADMKDTSQLEGYEEVAVTNASFFGPGGRTSPEETSVIDGEVLLANVGRTTVCLLPDGTIRIRPQTREEIEQCEQATGGGTTFLYEGKIAGMDGTPFNMFDEDFALIERRKQAHDTGEAKTAFAVGRLPDGRQIGMLIVTNGLTGPQVGQHLRDVKGMQYATWFDSGSSVQGNFYGDNGEHVMNNGSRRDVANGWAVYVRN